MQETISTITVTNQETDISSNSSLNNLQQNQTTKIPNKGQLLQIIRDNFMQSILSKEQTLNILDSAISDAIIAIYNVILNNSKILICGNGGSAADSQHFAAEFTGRYEVDRKPLAAIALTTDTSALTAIGNDYGFDAVFKRQVLALGNKGDILIAISTSGNSANVVQAVIAAKELGMKIIVMMNNNKDAQLLPLLSKDDILLSVPVKRTARVQEVHLLILHTICDAIDSLLYKTTVII